MPTARQIEANRANALKSTGPKTTEGRKAVRYNALKHGLLATQTLLDDEDERLFNELAVGLHDQLQPVGAFECVLVERVVFALWRLRRLLVVEAGMFASQRHGFLNDETGIGATFRRVSGASDAFSRLARYEAAIERGPYRTLHELQRAQEARKGQNGPLPIAIDVDVSHSGEVPA